MSAEKLSALTQEFYDELVAVCGQLRFRLGRFVRFSGGYFRIEVRLEANPNNRHDAWVIIRPAVAFMQTLEEIGEGIALPRLLENHRMIVFSLDGAPETGAAPAEYESVTDEQGQAVFKDLPDGEYGLRCHPAHWLSAERRGVAGEAETIPSKE